MLVTLEFDTDGKTNNEIFNEIAVLQSILDALTDIDADFKIAVKQAAITQAAPFRPTLIGGGIRAFDDPTLVTVNNFKPSPENVYIDEISYGQGFLSGK